MNDGLPPRPAGFWIRAVALAIDLVVFALVQASFGALARALWGPAAQDATSVDGMAFLFTLLFTAAYATTLHTVAGQTLGKSLVGIRVVDADGALLTAGPALLRYLAWWLSFATLGFGFLVAGLRKDKRALHDLIAGSRVQRPAARRRRVRRVVRSAPPVPAEPPSAAAPPP